MHKDNKIFALNPKEIEALVNVNHSNPSHILGMHEYVSGVYINAYIPGAVQISVVNTDTDQEYSMEQCYAEGFYSTKIENCKAFPYAFNIVMWDGSESKKVYDPYGFDNVSDMDLLNRFINNEKVQLNRLFGAHQLNIDGVEGVVFTLNVPDAIRVSVVGDFNGWDSRRGVMNKIDYTDCFELFVPGRLDGSKYKFEVLRADCNREMFADPYASCYEPYPGDASVVADIKYRFKDVAWLKARADKADNIAPLNIYEVYAPGWMKDEEGNILNYAELGSRLAVYVKSMGYNYVEFMPLMSYKDESSLGYDMYGAYAPDSRMGSPVDFMKMIDIFHGKGIGVILDMVPVRDIDCMLYWIETYHIDGVRLDDRELSKKLKAITDLAYPGVLSDVFFNVADCCKIISYMQKSPAHRYNLADNINNISAHDVMALSHDMVAGYKGFIDMMPGGYEDKFADLRILYALNMTFPGAKLMFMGQESGQTGGLCVSHAVDWSQLDFDANKYISEYTKALNKLYLKEPALYDNTEVEFTLSGAEGISIYSRYSKTTEDIIYVICNSRYKDVTGYNLTVTKKGNFKEIFSSDDIKYGGEGNNNKTNKKTDKNKQIIINLPALSVTVIKAGC